MNFINKAVDGFKKAAKPLALALGLSIPAVAASAAPIEISFGSTTLLTTPTNTGGFSFGDAIFTELSVDTDTLITRIINTGVNGSYSTTLLGTYDPSNTTFTLQTPDMVTRIVLDDTANSAGVGANFSQFSNNISQIGDFGFFGFGNSLTDNIVADARGTTITVEQGNLSAVPLPGAGILFVAGLGALASLRRRKTGQALTA